MLNDDELRFQTLIKNAEYFASGSDELGLAYVVAPFPMAEAPDWLLGAPDSAIESERLGDLIAKTGRVAGNGTGWMHLPGGRDYDVGVDLALDGRRRVGYSEYYARNHNAAQRVYDAPRVFLGRETFEKENNEFAAQWLWSIVSQMNAHMPRLLKEYAPEAQRLRFAAVLANVDGWTLRSGDSSVRATTSGRRNIILPGGTTTADSLGETLPTLYADLQREYPVVDREGVLAPST